MGNVPMSDVNFDKYPSCLSRQVLNKNRGRIADRTCSIVYWTSHSLQNHVIFFNLVLYFPHNYHMVKEEKGE